jgi:TatD DNase family protein
VLDIIDSHAHVDSERFADDRAAVLERAFGAGLRLLVNVGCDVATSRASIALAEADERIWATAGLHPHEAGRCTTGDLAEIEGLLAHPRVVAVGECGLDRGPHNDVPLERQEEVFRAQLRLAREHDLPVVVHNRDTYPDLFRILDDENRDGPRLRGIMHCFSGTPDDARRSVELGFFVSFSGVLTFKNAPVLREAALATPLEWTLVETDCPYLAPVPRRGKRNEPAFVGHTAQKLAELHGLGLDEVEDVTDRNAVRAYGLDEEVLVR